MKDCLVCENILKKYDNKKVLDNINVEIEKGKIYGLIGRNGVGKTTLLSIMSAQVKATSGKVYLCGEQVWENNKALRRICFSRELNPMSGIGSNNMKVKEYLKIASIFYENWDKGMEKDLLERFELDIKKRINKLSKGMMSMVTIIVAMCSKTEYTFLDEPVAGLDVVAREDFYRILLEEHEKTGRTFLISTHIIEEASDIFDEVIIMKNGKILLKENTTKLVESTVHITGKSNEIEEITKNLKVYNVEKIGRSMGATVRLEPGQIIKSQYEINIQQMNLQGIFIALCGKEG